MDLAVQNVTNATNLLPVGSLPSEEQMEGLFLPEEIMTPESLLQSLSDAKGFLMASGKYYGFRQEESTSFSQKLQITINDLNQPKEQKALDVKEGVKIHQFTKEHAREKESTVQKAEKSDTYFEPSRPRENSTKEKTRDFAEKHLVDAKEAHTDVKEHIQTPPPKVLYRDVFESRFSKTQKNEEEKSQSRKQIKEESTTREIAKQTAEHKTQKEKEKEKEGQGHSGGQNKDGKDDEKEEKKKPPTIEKVSFEKEFTTYGNKESVVGELLNMRVSQFDIILIFLEILKLAIKSRELERLMRWEEREMQLEHLQKVVENLKQQGNDQLNASVWAGCLAILSGFLPIVGHLSLGGWLQQKLSYVYSDFAKPSPEKLFKSLSKVVFYMSEMQKSTAQIKEKFSESTRTFDQHMTELHKSDGDENTRSMEDIKDYWKNIENFIYQTLQMFHEAIRQLYNN